MSADHKSSLGAVFLVLGSMLSIQCGASLAKSLFPLIGPEGITSLRLGIGTLILFVIFRPWRMRIERNGRLSLLMYGITLGTMNFLFYMSLRTIPLGIAVAIEFIGPLTIAMLSSRKSSDFIWIILAIVGLSLLLPVDKEISAIDPVGASYAFGAAICWALYIIFGKKAGTQHGAGSVAIGSMIGALLYCPVGLSLYGSELFSLSILPIAAVVALLSTAIPYSLEIIALPRLPAQTFGTLMSLEPAIAALSGLLFLNEHLTLLQWLAIGFVMVASMGATLTIKPRPAINEIT